MSLSQFKKELRQSVNLEKKEFLPKFFKTGKGQYGEGDKFLGVVVPDIKKISKKFNAQLTDQDLEKLLYSEWHEERFAGWFLISIRYKKSNEHYYNFSKKHIKQLNNWDLVDMIAPKVIGEYLVLANEDLFIKWSNSKSLWIRRIAVMSTWPKIRNNEFAITFKIAKKYLEDPEDLIHKATGWMLREIAKRDQESVVTFIKTNKPFIPRVMLRYAIERMDEALRKELLA